MATPVTPNAVRVRYLALKPSLTIDFGRPAGGRVDFDELVPGLHVTFDNASAGTPVEITAEGLAFDAVSSARVLPRVVRDLVGPTLTAELTSIVKAGDDVDIHLAREVPEVEAAVLAEVRASVHRSMCRRLRVAIPAAGRSRTLSTLRVLDSALALAVPGRRWSTSSSFVTPLADPVQIELPPIAAQAWALQPTGRAVFHGDDLEVSFAAARGRDVAAGLRVEVQGPEWIPGVELAPDGGGRWVACATWPTQPIAGDHDDLVVSVYTSERLLAGARPLQL